MSAKGANNKSSVNNMTAKSKKKSDKNVEQHMPNAVTKFIIKEKNIGERKSKRTNFFDARVSRS